MSTEIEKGGPRSRVYGSKLLGAPCRSAVVNSRHISAMYATDGKRRALPGYYMFDTNMEGEEVKVDAAWLLGLPRVRRHVYGHADKVELPSGFEVSKKGGAVKGTFPRWIEACVDPCYPNIAPEFEYDSDGSEDSRVTS